MKVVQDGKNHHAEVQDGKNHHAEAQGDRTYLEAGLIAPIDLDVARRQLENLENCVDFDAPYCNH